jgi:hypothetical protein
VYDAGVSMQMSPSPQEGIIEGIIKLSSIPTHKLMSLNLSFFEVKNLSSPIPFGGEPSAENYTDTVSIKDYTEPYKEELNFRLPHSSGFYYLDVGIIVIFEKNKKNTPKLNIFFQWKKLFK